MKTFHSKYLPIVVSLFIAILTQQLSAQQTLPVIKTNVGQSVTTDDGKLTITNIGHLRGIQGSDGYDPDIHSPKSAGFTADGKKLYVNSLEGMKTVVYDGKTLKKIKTVNHRFSSGKGKKWLNPSGYYPFTHYPEGDTNSFGGKPVEQAFSKDGKYLFVPYYRRTFDINAQDPSALAVIDTQNDSIILMTETGPLPKMVKVSNDGQLLAITHWGDNTVGFMDISDSDPKKWKHLPPITVGYKFKPDFSLTESVDRDRGSGYSLRGTVFLPGDSILVVGAMGGPTGVIDLKKMKYLGMIQELNCIRHIVLRDGMLYLSRNNTGEVYTVPLSEVLAGISNKKDNSKEIHVNGVKKVKVGGGARTLEVSPDGKYIFVVCNSASALYIISSQNLKVVGKIDVDSYPVGLDISPSGDILVTTSQGRNKKGGNAVDIFRLTYH